MDLLTGFLKGGLLMWPIFLCSIITIAIVIERYFVLRQASVNVPRFMIQIREHMKHGDVVEAINYCSEYNSPIANIIRKGLTKYQFGMDRIKESIESAGKQEIYKLEKELRESYSSDENYYEIRYKIRAEKLAPLILSILTTISGIAPILRFLATVTGMISAFMKIESLGGNASPTDLAGGIWEALLTTAFGLSVGIIAYLFYNYFVTRINKLISEMEITSTDFIDLIYEQEHGRIK